MNTIYYIGLDIHKKTITYCIKRIDGFLVQQGTVLAERKALSKWLHELPGPWCGAMEATIFTGWVYDFLKPHAVDLKVAHPEMLKAITAAKKKNDRADAEKIADLLRVNLLPECHMLSEALRELRRMLRYRNMIVRTAVKMKNKISGLLMETGTAYNKKRLHGRKYFEALLERVEDVPESVKDLLKLSRSSLEMFEAVQKKLVKTLREDKLIHDLGFRDRRTVAVHFGTPGRQLLRTMQRPTGIGRQRATRSHLQEAEQTSADDADRNLQAGPALESGAGIAS